MWSITRVDNNKNELLRDKIQPNEIHNRYDILYDDYDLYEIGNNVIPLVIQGNVAVPGLYLTNYSCELLSDFFSFIFSHYPNVDTIHIKHSYTPIEFTCPYPYWHIELPKTIQEFDASLHQQVRYNTKWYPKKIQRDLGDFHIEKYELSEITDEMVSLYLHWKFLSHGFVFREAPRQYLRQAGISNAYVLYLGDSIAAIAFTCDTGANVYFENFSYDAKYHKYSLGMVLYYFIITDLISMGKKCFYLSGGWLDYKKRYNGILTMTYSGNVYRNQSDIRCAFNIAKKIYKCKLPYWVRRHIVKLWTKLHLAHKYHHIIMDFFPVKQPQVSILDAFTRDE